MKIILADHFGTCFGVRDAIALAQAEAPRGPLTILGQLVHNPIVRKDLRARGIRESSAIPEAASARVIITAHGASDQRRALLQARGLAVLDATCPLVQHAHTQLKRLVKKKYFPIVIGIPGHVEVIGLTEDFPDAVVINGSADLENIPPRSRYGIISQTTQPIERVREFVGEIQRKFPRSEVHFIDTVCRPTKDRQLALQKLIAQADTIVVVGGYESNNTRQLVETCRAAGRHVLHLERPEELNCKDIVSSKTIGVTAGTSTLPETFAAVVRRLEEISRVAPNPTSKHEFKRMA